MITLTRLSGSVFALNSDLIERVESTPDTIITLVDGKKYVVAESVNEVISIVRAHRAEIVALSGYVRVPAVDQHGYALVAPHEPPEQAGARRSALPRPSLTVVSPQTTDEGRTGRPDAPRRGEPVRSVPTDETATHDQTVPEEHR
ncbi:flagellar FlbD family protein [Nocardioides sp. TRM66260-LWL]|uniref:flagellar FlbD family protein n=1 Tax=Nocardioides sp. TRM66260-LWL TaxID=2874478 RepID=UPI001CC7FAE6|nr:flagellar FlbD family protein [Nocardioides sp. TRM66260-LWL]MBZ5735188.1 flagellar FlbD family protein [Nocardioides sp. TRM66260-LWL]